MSKITLANVSNLQQLTSAAAVINANNALLTTALDNTLSRDGTAPNQMLNNFDMNSNQILNLPSPATVNSPVRLIDVAGNPTITVPPVGTSGATVPLLNGNNTWSGTNTYTVQPVFPMPANTIRGNNTGSTGNVLNLTQAQATAMMNIFTPSLSGTVPASGGGTTNFLRADGTFAAPATSSGGAWTNVVSVKTTTYAVVNGDIASTLALGGGLFYTVSFAAAGGYSSTFAVLVTNLDTSRGKRISPTGITSFILWPGQSCFVYIANGSWNITNPGRWQKPGVNYFVDTVNGADTNDGLASSAGAFKTIGAAVLSLYQNVDCQNSAPTINIAAGTYTESIVLSGQITGYNYVLFQGAGSASVTWKPSSSACLIVSDNAECQIQGIKFDNTGGASGVVAISMHQPSVIDVLSDINFGQFLGGSHINNDKGGYVNLPPSYTISGSASTHISMSSGAIVTQSGGGTVTTTGSPTIGIMYQGILGTMINFAGVVSYSGGPSAGTQKYSMDFLSAFSSNASGIPGTVAGAVGHGSVFA